MACGDIFFCRKPLTKRWRLCRNMQYQAKNANLNCRRCLSGFAKRIGHSPVSIEKLNSGWNTSLAEFSHAKMYPKVTLTNIVYSHWPASNSNLQYKCYTYVRRIGQRWGATWAASRVTHKKHWVCCSLSLLLWKYKAINIGGVRGNAPSLIYFETSEASFV